MSKKKSKSILAVTCGNVNTTAYLIERSKQGYRLKATSYASLSAANRAIASRPPATPPAPMTPPGATSPWPFKRPFVA